jgi:signal transduction histidine kinase
MDSEQQVNLLLVDDRPENIVALSAILDELGQNYVSATSGMEALKCVLNQEFAVILLDVKMPDMDGFETATLIRTRERSRHIPIIFMTAYSQEETQVFRGYSLGAVDFLFKPLQPEILKSKVSVFIELHRKTEEVRRQSERLLEIEQEAHQRELAQARQQWEAQRLREEMENEKRTTAKLRESYEQLRALEAQRDDLTHMIVHDLRTPLTSLITGLHTLEGLGELNADQREFMDMAVKGGYTLLGMINDLLDISKMEDGSLNLTREIVSPRELASSATGQVAWLAEQKELSVRVSLPDDLPAFTGDVEKLRRVLVNLLGNAVKFTPTGGSVEVLAKPDETGAELLFGVRDTGEGIPKEAFGRIFEKFGQVETRKAGKKMSTGLGLTFCKMAVEAHGGRIWVESEVGKGSTFWFTVPLGAVVQDARHAA